MDPLTTANEGMLIVAMFRTVRFAAQIKLGKLTSNPFPLALMVAEEVMLATCVLKVFRRLLLSIWRVWTVFRLMPSRVLKKVLETVTLLALDTVAGKVNCERAGRAVQEIVLTEVNELNRRVERTVKLFKKKVPPIEPMFKAVKPVRNPAFSTWISPVTCWIPSRARSPTVLGPTTMLPEKVEQPESAVASAAELTVAVDCVQTAD